MVQTHFPPMIVKKGSKIAQLIPIPQLIADMTKEVIPVRGNSGFGSTGELALLTMSLNHRPVVAVKIVHEGEQLQLLALLDTGADITILSSTQWPPHWPLRAMMRGVEGVGGTVPIQRSVNRVQVVLDQRIVFTHITVMPLPSGVNMLIGRDVLNHLGLVLTDKPF